MDRKEVFVCDWLRRGEGGGSKLNNRTTAINGR